MPFKLFGGSGTASSKSSSFISGSNSPFFSKDPGAKDRNRQAGDDKKKATPQDAILDVPPVMPTPPLHEQPEMGDEAAAALDLLINSVKYDTLKSAFDKFDLNDDGFLDADEVDAALRQVGVRFTPEQIDAFIRLGNTSEDRWPGSPNPGALSEEEFLAMIRRHRRMGKGKAKTSVAWEAKTQRGAGTDRTTGTSPLGTPPKAATQNGRSPPQRAKTAGVTTKGTSPARRTGPGAPGTRAGGAGQRPRPNTYQARAAAAEMTPSRMAVGVDLEKRLEDVIGLEPIKDKLRSLKDTLVKRRFRKEVGAPLVDIGPLHMIFTGNPGCGKTSIARLLAKLLYDLGAVQMPNFVEVQRTDLVAAHIGQTGPKTRAKIDEAKGGILFVDEAYRLTSNSEKDFGTEALEEIMTDMTTGDPLIIAAGYPDQMNTFLAANEGLKRRFGFTFDFPNFPVEELAQMCLHKLSTQGFLLEPTVTTEAVAKIIEQHTDEAWRAKNNGGVAEKLARGAMQCQDARLDPTKLGLEEYRKQAGKLELADLEQAAAALKYA